MWKLFRHAETPRLVKVVAVLVLAYALSPIDLIPDFIPVVGLLDDLVLIPLGIAFVVRLLPRDVLDDCRRRADSALASKKQKVVVAAALVVVLWLAVAFILLRRVVRRGR
jgi:uncharacterized membrane protein YkvA (DUF1232 family)